MLVERPAIKLSYIKGFCAVRSKESVCVFRKHRGPMAIVFGKSDMLCAHVMCGLCCMFFVWLCFCVLLASIGKLTGCFYFFFFFITIRCRNWAVDVTEFVNTVAIVTETGENLYQYSNLDSFDLNNTSHITSKRI